MKIFVYGQIVAHYRERKSGKSKRDSYAGLLTKLTTPSLKIVGRFLFPVSLCLAVQSLSREQAPPLVGY